MKQSKTQRKPTRTISGVAPLAVMLPPRKCDHGACLYCPTLNAPQSYTPQSPAVIRAIEHKYSAKNQVAARLENFKNMGHPTDKIELIIMGGTFLSYDRNFQFKFIKECYDALNKSTSENLKKAKKKNETAKHRCVALCIETRPDVCTKNHIKDMLEFGATRIEIGVQAPDDKIYKKVNRGHTVKDVIDATARLKKAGFKLGYHLMPGLPGSDIKKDIKLFKKLFCNEFFKPDQIKIYPCQVIKGSGIESLYYGGEYMPYSKEQTSQIISEMLKLTPSYCRIMRVMREIPLDYLVAGIKNLDMRQDIETRIREKESKIKEIRFREIGFALRDKRKINTKIFLNTIFYDASEGEEYFIQAVNKDNILFGLIRLRLEKDKKIPAMVRELHVYGPTLNLGEKAKEEWQHKGLGKDLMKKAEGIAKEKGYKNIRVISGIGVREYYKKLGYTVDKDDVYVEKEL
jgi:elongator complex protein 3